MAEETRSERLAARRAGTRRKTVLIGVSAVAAVTLVAAVAAFALTRDTGDADAPTEATQTVDVSVEETVAGDVEPVAQVEVPDVVGSPIDEAEMLLAYAGFAPTRVEAVEAPDGSESGTVVMQDPIGGTLADDGSEVTVAFVPQADAASDEDAETSEHFVVVLDPGHQARSNLDPEPNGPDSTEMKEKVRAGATGVDTRIPEYETALQIGLLVRDLLADDGVEVVMTRTSNDVDISNAERAQIANRVGADLFVRIHCDGAGDPDVNGISTLYPSGNPWVAPIEARSKRAATSVQAAMVAATGAADRGLTGRSDITGFNWSKVPAILVEAGFLSNPVEDKLLSGADYRAKVAQGIADGVLEHLASE
jgi:N-acetylmuramoyl-L-alanine amidase